MTNTEKFIEVFGFVPDTEFENLLCSHEMCKRYDWNCDEKCPYNIGWWHREYKKPDNRRDKE